VKLPHLHAKASQPPAILASASAISCSVYIA
jgi:hypothetical protein